MLSATIHDSAVTQRIGGRAWSRVRGLTVDTLGTIGAALNDQHIRLAVTGLSRAGKTVFITSVIHNLIALGQGRDTLPRLTARLQQGGRMRLRRVSLLPTSTETIPYFDFRAKLAGLAAEKPSWPERTGDIAQVSLLLEIEHESSLRQRFGFKRVRLDILDYPGE